jgi:hypothetical protein
MSDGDKDSNAMDISPVVKRNNKPSLEREPSFTKSFFSSMSANKPKPQAAATVAIHGKVSARLFGEDVKPNITRPSIFGKQRSKSEAILPMAMPKQEMTKVKPIPVRPNFREISARAESVPDLGFAFQKPTGCVQPPDPQGFW